MEVSGSYGQLQLLRPLATSDLCEVYLAREVGYEENEGLVVVKRLLPEPASNAAFVRTFLDEAGFAGRLRHPSIARILDIGEYEGTTFVAVEYVPGGTVTELMTRRKGRPLPLGDALFIGAEVCAALDAARTATGRDGRPIGAIHGGLKPDNVLVSIDGEIKVTDFWMARARARLEPSPRPAPHLAPEILGGAAPNAASDVYACGALLGLLLTGSAPPDAGSTASASNLLDTDDPELPEPVARIVSKAMASSPEGRHSSAEALRLDLVRVAGTLGVASDSRSLRMIARKAFPVLGATAPVVEAVSSTAPPSLPCEEPGASPVARPLTAGPQPPASPPRPAVLPGATPAPVTTPQVARPHEGGSSKGLVALIGGLAGALLVVLLLLVGALLWLKWQPQGPVSDISGPAAQPFAGAPGQAVPAPLPFAPPALPPEPPGLAAPQPGALDGQPALPSVGIPDAGVGTAPSTSPPADGGSGEQRRSPADEERPRTTPPRGPPGHLTVLTRPYSRVYVDGRLLGTTPVIRREVASGRRAVRMVTETGATKRRVVDISPGRLTQINETF